MVTSIASIEVLQLFIWFLDKYGRQAIKFVISSCGLCKNTMVYLLSSTRLQIYENGVNFVKPFHHTDIDFTGHLWVREGEEMEMYILIFVCFNVRVINLESVNDVSTHSVVLAMVRFIYIYTYMGCLSIYTQIMHDRLWLGAI